MAVEMVSKRSTRMAWTEGVHLDEEMVVPYRPRSRRNSLQDELCRAQPPLDTADVYRKTNSTSTSQREFRELSSSLDSSVEALMYGKELLDGKTVRTEKCKQLREPLVPELADSPQVQLTIQPTPPSEKIIPTEGRPFNFGIVVPGVYRSSYPKPEDFGFINNLELKTIVTLVQKDEPDEVYSTFMSSNRIRHHVFNMKGTKKVAIPIRTMRAILRLVLDRQNHPVLIHCNHGKHRTGCVVAVVRKVSGWDLAPILDEYRSFAEPKVREVDVKYITSFELSELSNLFVYEANMRFRIRNFLRISLFSLLVVVIWIISGQQLTSATRRVQWGDEP